MIAAVVPGMLHFRVPNEEKEQIAAVSHGLIKIENGEVLILIDSAERPEEIDINRARREADAAKEAIQQKRSIQNTVRHRQCSPVQSTVCRSKNITSPGTNKSSATIFRTTGTFRRWCGFFVYGRYIFWLPTFNLLFPSYQLL